jgi:hypothetical protein
MLEQAVGALRRMSRPTQIIVHDNGSTDSDTLRTLERLSSRDIEVVYRQAIKTADDLNEVNHTVQEFFGGIPKEPYIVSDCDVDMGIAHPSAIDVFLQLLDLFPEAECVGPMLRIRDVPPTYPLFNRMMNRHIEQFWGRRPCWTETDFGRVAYIEAVFDTTLALHRAGQPFCRFRRGLRVYEPFEARHLDWYIGPGENSLYAETSGGISHWNNNYETDIYRNTPLDYTQYYAVRSGPDGLEEYTEVIIPEPITTDRNSSSVMRNDHSF